MSNIVQALGLVVDDRDPQAIFDAMVDRWVELAPDAQLRNGSPEAILMEAVATAAADSIYAANRMISVLVDAVLAIIGAPYDTGQAATGVVTITFDGTQTGTITAGTAMSAAGLDLVVRQDTAFTAVTSVAVPVAAVVPGSAGNALAAGEDVTLDDPVPYAAAAAVSVGLAGGADPETDDAYRARVANIFARLTSSLVLPVHFSAFALEDVRVGRATSISLWDGANPATIGADLGHLTTVLFGRGTVLDAAVLDELRDAMQAISSAGTTIHAIPAAIVVQPIAITVHPMPGAVASDVQAAVAAVLSAWLDPAAWTYGEPIRVNEIIARAASATGVDYVTTVTTPAADVAVAAYELAQAGIITVTVA